MALGSTIKGITIEIGGDTTKLQQALKEPEKAVSDLNRELSQIERSLQFQPGNVELVGQKFEVLSGLVDETSKKLEVLKAAQEQVEQQFKNGDIGEKEYREFQREIIKTEDQLKSLIQQAGNLDTEFKRSAQAAGKSMQDLGDKISGVGKSLAPLSAAITGLGALSVSAFSTFDDAIRGVQATIGATAEEVELLSEAARDAGKTTRFTAQDSAEALNYLALAGYDTERAIETLPKILRLAAAGNMDLAYASDLVTDSMAALGLETDKLDGFIDELVRTSQRSNTNVSQLGEAILTVGGQASLAGLSTNELNTALGILADNGIKGSEGGTALRNTLKNLYTPTDKAAAALESLGVKTSTANGQLRDVQDVLQDLDRALGRLSEADRIDVMNQIFDSRVIAPANALLKDSADRWNELSVEILNSAGAAEEAAEILEGGLGGSFRKLKSAAGEAAIAFGEALAPAIEVIASAITNIALAFANLPGPIQTVIAFIAVLVAALAPLLIITGSLIKNVGIIVEKFPLIITSIKKFGSALSALATNPFVLIIAGIVALTVAFVHLWNTSEEFRDFWIGLWEGIRDFFVGIVESIVSFFTETIPGAFATVIESIQAAWDSVKEFAQGIISFFTDTIPNAITSFIDNVKGALQSFADSVKTFFTVTIPEAFSSFVESLSELPYKIGYILGQAIGHIAKFFIDAYNYIVDTIKKIPEAIANIGKSIAQFFVDLFDRVKEILSNAIDSIKEFASNLVQTIKDGFAKAIEAVVDFAISFKDNLVNSIKEVISNVVNFAKELPANLKKAFSAAITAVKNWGKDFIARGVQSVKDFVSGVIETVKSLPDRFLQLGKDMITGFINGIKEMFKKAWEAITDFFKGIVDGVKSILGIKSPSRVFAEIGRNMAAGVGVGWEGELDNVEKSLNGAAARVFGFDGGHGSMSPAMAGGYGSMQSTYIDARKITVRSVDRLEPVADEFYRRKVNSRAHGGR